MSSTQHILNQLSEAKTNLRTATKAIEEVAAPVAEIGGEIAAHVGFSAVGLPQYGMFAAPVAGKLAKGATKLALEGVNELGATVIDGIAGIVKATDSHKPSVPMLRAG